MSNTQTALLCALIVASGLFLGQNLSNAQSYAGGPYQLMNHSNTTANVGVFRLDTASGEVSYCFLSRNDTLICSKPVR